jgi:hypothetical protein
MKLRFPIHFQNRMSERGIDIDHIKKAISKPDSKRNVFQGRILVSKKINGKIMEVVYYVNSNEYIIITAYYL